jgi:oligosaccharide repeat unit polymerase
MFATICVIYNINFWEVEYSWNAYIITTAGFLAMLLPEFLMIKKVGYKSTKNIMRLVEQRRIYNVVNIDVIVNIFISLCCIVLTILYVKLALKRGMSLGADGLNAIGMAKYDETDSQSAIEKIAYRLLMVLFYVFTYFVIKNKFLMKEKLRNQIKYFIPILCYFVACFFGGNRLGLLKCLLAIYEGIFSMMYMSADFTKKDIRKIMRMAFIGGVITIVTFYLLRIITKVNTSTAERTFIDYITYYIGSPVYLFSKYLDNPFVVHAKNRLLGETTFTSVLQELGFSPEYENNFLYVGGKSCFAGNVMTWFQGPLNDFGFIGMLIFTFTIYWTFDWVLYKGILKSNSEACVLFMMFFGFVIVMSFYYCQTMWAISFMNIIYITLILFFIRIIPKLSIMKN